MDKIPTSNQFIRSKASYLTNDLRYKVQKLMVEFAKLHLKAQAEAIHDKAEIIFAPFTICSECGNGDPAIDGNSIDNAYPLDKIK